MSGASPVLASPAMRRRSPLLFILPLACASLSCASARPRPGETRYRVGDFITYRYSGSALEVPVLLEETVVAQEGNRLRIDVVAKRGGERRAWVQVLTDTPANQAGNVVDALYEQAPDGSYQKLANEGGQDLMRLYEGTYLVPDGRATGVKSEECEVALGKDLRCTCTTGDNRYRGKAIRSEDVECRDFLWTHAGGRFWDPSDESDVLRVEVVEFGRNTALSAKPLDPSAP